MNRLYYSENTKNYRLNRVWDPHGKLLIKCPFTNNEIIIRRVWDKHGNLRERSQTKNGKMHGLCKSYDISYQKTYYRNDTPIGEHVDCTTGEYSFILIFYFGSKICRQISQYKFRSWFSCKCFVRHVQKKYRKRSLKELFNKLNFSCYDVFLIITSYLDNDSIRMMLTCS